MTQSSRQRVLIVAGLAGLVALSGRDIVGQGLADQAGAARSALSTPGSPPPLGLGLGNPSVHEVLERIADRSDVHLFIDPNTLSPVALSPDSNNGFTWHASKPYTCWALNPREHDNYAPGTAVACYVKVTLADGFVHGDGSLDGNPAGKPDNFFGFSCSKEGFEVMDYTRDQWEAVRYYDENFNQIGTIRLAQFDGTNYNYTTGKSVELHAHFIEIDVMDPVDGTGDNEFTKFLGDDYGPVTGPRGELLANSAGRIDYTPFLASVLYMAGPHPLDVFFLGDVSGVLPVCNALE